MTFTANNFIHNRFIKISIFLLLVFLFSIFGFFQKTYASYQKIAPGDTITLGEFVFDDNFVATTTDCTIGITNPLNAELVPSTTLMTANNDGWHYYNYTTAGNAPSGVWPSIMICGTVQGGDFVIVDKSFIVDWSVVSTSTIKEVVDESLAVATSSLAAVIGASTEATVTTASSSLFATLPGTIWSYSSRTLTSFGTLIYDIVSDVWGTTTRRLSDATLDSGSLATQSYIDTATSTLTAEMAKGWTVTLSDFGGTTASTTSTYKAKLQVLNYATVPTDADSLPTVVITNSAGTVIVPDGIMTKDSNGTYSYSYTIGGSAIGGVWETVVSVVVNGETVKVNDYWSVSSSPADVNIIEITDKVIPTITASVRIDNKGNAGSDFYYVYCIVDSAEGLCGGDNDIDSASATVFIDPGSFADLQLTLDDVPTAGTYWFKVQARALAEINWAAATEQFTAEEFEAQTLSFSISNNSVGFGSLNVSSSQYATGDGSGSGSDTADAHTISASTNASGGYIVSVTGATLTCNISTCEGAIIDAIGAIASPPSPGTKQFGSRLNVNSGTGSVSAPYNGANWAFDAVASPDEVATGSGDDVTTVFGARYIGNIDISSEFGDYATNLTYIITGTF